MKTLGTLLTMTMVTMLSGCGINPISYENGKPGTRAWEITNLVTPTDWLATQPGQTVISNAEIEGYASATSVNVGDTIRLYVRSQANYKIEFFRMGWYQGLGGRKVRPDIFHIGAKPQPGCLHDADTHRIECQWTEPHRIDVPTSWVSGVYLAKLTILNSGKQSYIIFVVRRDERPSDFLFQTSVTTYQAYNLWGGFSLYAHRGRTRASEVSFERPYDQGYGSEGHEGAGDFFRWEINMLRWLERRGYNMTYATNIDVHRDPDLLLNKKGFLSVGHDEYWSQEMRQNVERAQEECVSLGFFSANSMYWRTRISANSTGVPFRTITVHKDCSIDPSTAKWRESCGGAIPARPEDALIGVMYDEPINIDNDMIVENTTHWAFQGTGLNDGDRLLGLVGYEADRFFGSAPSQTVALATSPTCRSACRARVSSCGGPISTPCDCSSPEGISNMSVYETANGSVVFATGTIQWSWGLDDYESPHDSSPHCSRVQPSADLITRNVLDRFRQASCEAVRSRERDDAPRPAQARISPLRSGP